MALSLKSAIKLPSFILSSGIVQSAIEHETKRVRFNHICKAGYNLDSEDTNKLARIAQELGAQQGYSTTVALDQFSRMLARQTVPYLDVIGLSPGDFRQTMKSLTSIGIPYNEAFMQAVMIQTERRLGTFNTKVIDIGNGYGKVEYVLSFIGGGFIVPDYQALRVAQDFSMLPSQVDTGTLKASMIIRAIDSCGKGILEPRVDNKPHYVL